MEGKTAPLYLIIFILLAVILYLLFACYHPKLEYSKVLKSIPGESPIVARVSIHENGQFSLTTKDGDPGEECRIKPGKGDIPRCRGLDQGKVVAVRSIPLLEIQGSICYVTYDIGGFARQVCWP